MKKLRPAAFLFIGSILGCSSVRVVTVRHEAEPQADRIRPHVRYLSDDLLEGRLPGTRGGELAAKYLASQAEALGLRPGANGDYYQKVPLVGIDTDPSSTLTFNSPEKPGAALRYLEDFVGADETLSDKTRFEGEVVFVGYGIVAPEYQWNDYAGVDVRGKVVLMLANEPFANDPNSKMFEGTALTYYGRWTYKFEEATRRGAAGALLIHTDASAGYGWSVVRNSWGRERPYPSPEGKALSGAAWIRETVAKEALARGGYNLDELRERAQNSKFKAIATNISASFDWKAKVRPIPTQNVVAVLPGSDPELSKEYIIYTAHYDHLGFATPENGDAICNGAVDNAGGCATILEIARVLTAGAPLKRSVIFAWVTAEEGGLRGSEYYALHPTVDVKKIVANINVDGIPLSGDPAEIAPLGYDRSKIRPFVESVAKSMDLTIIPDRNPAQGYYFRSDHFSFAKVGVPAISVGLGYKYRGKPDGWGREREESYRRDQYHRPADNYNPEWDFVAPTRVAEFCLRLGTELGSVPSSVPSSVPKN